jgi:hypothetical protein
MASSIEVVIPSSERSFPTILVPPETRRMMGFVFSGSTDERKTPLVTKIASQYGSSG